MIPQTVYYQTARSSRAENAYKCFASVSKIKSLQERDKQSLTKAVVFELVQALKFKCTMHEHNYTAILEMILQDQGENVSEDVPDDKVFSFSFSFVIFDQLKFGRKENK